MDCAARTLERHDALIDRAAVRAPVRGRSRTLCAALGVLAEDAAIALGAGASAAEIGEAAALLSLLTKVDDEVIDAAAFHGGPLRRGGHRGLRRRVRAYLAPTLDSLVQAEPTQKEARCVLAADVGRRLRALAATADRLARLHEVIAAGWETQVRAVDLLSRHPAESTLAEVAHVTAAISGDWLLMITMVGGLPTRREVSQAEMDAFTPWGWHIQRADALCDFSKDAAEGLSNSWAGRVCYQCYGEDYADALRRRESAALRSMLETCAGACLPCEAELDAAGRDLDGLGNVPVDLAWIHAMLVERWRSRTEGC